jgi:hypothetical protein
MVGAKVGPAAKPHAVTASGSYDFNCRVRFFRK